MINNILGIRKEFKSLFEHSLDFLFIYDLNGNILDINEVVLKNLAYSKEQILSMSIFDFLVEEEKSQAIKALKEIKATGKFAKYNIFKIKKKKSGGFIFLEVSGIPLKNQGEIIAFLGIGHDITTLKKTQQTLIESEEKYRNLFDESPIGIMIFDMEGNLIDRNSTIITKFPELLGTELIGKDFRDIISYFKDSNQLMKVFAERYKAMRNGMPLKPFEFPISTKEDRELWLSWQSSLVRITDETFIQVLIQDITDKKETEQKIIDSEKKFRVLFNNSTSGIAYHKIVYDSEGNPVDYVITDVNPQYEEILPFKKEDVINKKATVVYQVESAPFIDIYAKVADTQEPITFETYFPPTDMHFKISVISLKKGEFITVFDDIADRKRAELKLKESEEKFRTIAEQSFMGIAIIQDDLIKYANQAMLDIFGYSMDEVKSWKLLEYLKLFPPEEKEFMSRQERRRQEEYDSSQHNYQVRFIKKSGDIGWLDLFSSAIQYKGRPAGMVSIIDITDRLQAGNKIRESEEKFRTITEQSVIGVLIITGEDWDIKYSNQKFADIIGYEREEIEDWKLENFFKLVHPEDVEDLIKLARRKYKGGLEIVKNYQFRVFKKTGEIIWIEIESKTIPYKDGLADLVSAIDITEKKEAEKLIIEENTKLLELHEMRKDIINRVSHELKTPLTSIYGASEILMAKCKDEMSDNVLSFMEILYRGAIRLKELVDNLLDSSLLDSKNFELKLKKEDIIEIITEVVDEMTHLADLRQLRLNTDLPDNLFLDVDKLRLRQAFNNIISNAIKNTPTGGQVFINLIETSNFVDIKIKDTGVGITEKEKEKLFEKFGKIERYGMNLDVDIEGSGLGLYISKEIVELHGGQILVESEGRHKGSTFTIRLFRNR